MQQAAWVQVLDGLWQIATDPQNTGREDRWFERVQTGAQDTPVPSVIQQTFPAYHGVAWYWHSFACEYAYPDEERVLLHFGAVDYRADVWVNGQYAGSYEGGETPFEFDISGLILPGAGNLLAVRVLNPTNEDIDGYVLAQTPHRNKAIPSRAGSAFNSGGIMYPVELRIVPTVRIKDVFAQPDTTTGEIAVMVTVHNAQFNVQAGAIAVSLSPAAGGEEITRIEKTLEFPPGESQHELGLALAQPHLWNLDDPYLYRVTSSVTVAGQRSHTHAVRCGFRDFRVVDGFFYLNGKRIFVKSTHTGNCMPIGQQVAVIPDHVRRDFINAKASGFNMVRFIAGVGYPIQLDFCDEIGLMVYEECFAGWVLGQSAHMGERFDRNTEAMIRRDRNHPCVTVWGLLNETEAGPVFDQARDFLPRLRQLDPTRLVLLNSGRFDGWFDVGSLSNPGGLTWEYAWGSESADSPRLTGLQYPSRDGAGDYHFYPHTPQTGEANALIRNLGRNSNPVFLSEYGIGSMMDVIREWRGFEQVRARPDLEDAAWLREQSEAFYADWARLGFEGVYPFAEDLLRESQRLHARQRLLGFDLIRSNPNLCGYNLTGMLDHAITGEGLWTFWREWKPATFEAVADGWSSLRWCLFANPTHIYAGSEIMVETSLANEGVLQPGTYPARFRISGPDGVVWEQVTQVNVPNPAPLAVSVLRETIRLTGPAGKYVLAANLESGGAPNGGRLEFYVSDQEALPQLTGSAMLWGIDATAATWLVARGLSCRAFAPDMPATNGLILVGQPADADPQRNPTAWQGLTQCMQQGATVVFLNPSLFAASQAALDWLPLEHKGRCYTFNDWLYHKECVANRHPVFAGLPGPGIMDWDYYGPVIPHEVFEGQDTPDETMAAAFATGYYAYPRAYGSSLLMAGYRRGQGRFILNSAYLLENLGVHPAADRLLLNLIRYALR